MKRKLLALGLLLTLQGLPALGEPGAAATVGEVRGIRVGLDPQRTRLVFDLDAAGAYRLLTLDNPPRVVLDFPAAISRFNYRQIPLRGTPVARVRSALQPDGTLRYVFDLRQPVQPRVFDLPPNQDRGHRVVLDLYPAQAVTAQAPAAAPAPQTEQVRPLRTPPTITPEDATRLPNPMGDAAGEWSGSISLQTRLFPQGPAFDGQDEQNLSLAIEPEYYLDWDGGRQRFAMRAFGRVDANDDERSHADLREFYWRLEQDRWVFKAGVDVVFWGVAESRHLVDIINQTDRVENIDREDKLGQLMLNVDYLSDSAGTWQAWVLPWFRERTFPGEDGRLRVNPAVDTDDPLWDSGDEEEHVDLALRWSHYIGDWDIGLAHFSGTAREPLLIPGGTPQRPTLRPLYLQIDQTSLDLQATRGAWLWKLEAIYNDNKVEDYFAAVGGFEYTRFGIADSAADLGWLLEYHYDERGENPQEALQNDLYTGLRLSGNDIAGSRLLAGFTVDLDNGSTFGNVEAARRLGESWTITVEARTFFNTDEDDPLHDFRDDDYIELQLDRFF
ncbi:MAG: hypothetical protein CME59_06715 [Halioglobus sp.]|nr:hypothetical protein [Halioglobus sp.]